MRYPEKIPRFLLFAALLLSALLFLSCDGGPGGDPPPPTNNQDSIGVDASVQLDGDTLDTVTITLENEAVASGWIDTTLEQRSEPNESVLLGVDSDEYVSENGGSKVLDLSRDRDYQGLVFRMEELPDSVNVTFPFTESDSAVAADLYINNSLVAESAKEPTVAVEYGTDPVTARVEGEYFQTKEVDFTPDEKQMTVPITLGRRQVTVNVTPQDSTGTVRSETITKVYEPYQSDSSKIEGKGLVELPARSGEREFFSDLITEEPDSEKLDRATAEGSFSAGGGADIEASLTKLPACSDSIDNDGDGAVDKAEGPACTDLEGEYDPQDDNEILKRFSRATGRLFNDSTFVSKTAGERSAKIRMASNPLPWSVTVAKGEIKHAIEVQRSDSIPDQAHATHLKTGASNDNLTVEKTSNVTADADTANGFVWIRVHGIDRTFFADGPHYAVYGWHGCKVRGNCGSIEGSGRFYYYAELQNGRGHSWSYIYEPEEVPEKNQKSAQLEVRSATLESGECRDVSKTDTVCRVPAGQVKKY